MPPSIKNPNNFKPNPSATLKQQPLTPQTIAPSGGQPHNINEEIAKEIASEQAKSQSVISLSGRGISSHIAMMPMAPITATAQNNAKNDKPNFAKGKDKHSANVAPASNESKNNGNQQSDSGDKAIQPTGAKAQTTSTQQPLAVAKNQNFEQANAEAKPSQQNPKPAPPAKQANVQQRPIQQPQQVNTSDSFFKLLIGLQFVAIFIVIFSFYPGPLFFNTTAMIVGAFMIALGLFLGIWAVYSFGQKITPNPRPQKHSILSTGGPYKYMRHPMYSAMMIASIGLTLVYPSITRILGLGILIFVLITKIGIEEYLLAKRYSHYARYQQLTGRYFPNFRTSKIDLKAISSITRR